MSQNAPTETDALEASRRDWTDWAKQEIEETELAAQIAEALER